MTRDYRTTIDWNVFYVVKNSYKLIQELQLGNWGDNQVQEPEKNSETDDSSNQAVERTKRIIKWK